QLDVQMRLVRVGPFTDVGPPTLVPVVPGPLSAPVDDALDPQLARLPHQVVGEPFPPPGAGFPQADVDRAPFRVHAPRATVPHWAARVDAPVLRLRVGVQHPLHQRDSARLRPTGALLGGLPPVPQSRFGHQRNPSLRHVSAPTIPSTFNPARRWNSRITASVLGP